MGNFIMPTIKIHNISTNKIIEREMNADELAQWEADKAAAEAAAAEAAAKEAARQALLDKLGITADEAKLLLG
jgi:phosphopantetheinyl transferase (holo-ACP synthase)